MTENPYSPPLLVEPPVLLPREAKPGEVVLQFMYDQEYLTQAMKRFNSQKHAGSLVKRLLFVLFMALVAVLAESWFLKAFLICGALFILFSQYLTRYLLLRNVSKSPHFNQPATLVISEAGVYAEQILQDTHFRWPAFTECIRMQDGYLLMQGPNQFHWLSDANVQQPADIERLADLFRRHVAKVRET